MKTILALLSLIIFNAKVFSQENGLPFRVGNKFGISDKNGNVIIKPDYDYISINLQKGKAYFQAFSKKDTTVFSSFIFNNKLILSNKEYSDYHIDSDFIIATKHQIKKNSDSKRIQKTGEINYLYDFAGKKIFDEGLAIISIIEDFEDNSVIREPKKDLHEVLLITKDLNGKFSILVYDKISKKITRILLNKTPFLNIKFNYEDNYTDKTITCIYEDETGKGKKIKLKIENNLFKIFSTEVTDISKKNNRSNRNDDFLLTVDDAYLGTPFENKEVVKNYNGNDQKKVLSINRIKIKSDIYYAPKNNEEIEITKKELNENERYILSSKGKVGLFYVYANSLLVPIKYDEIMQDDASRERAVFILKNKNKYGIFIYNAPNHKIIEPIFDKIPLLVDYNYFGEGQPLFKLFDENGKLFCYANEEGKLFYSEK